MGARSLTVLMWKHGTVRVRRFIHTVVDLGAPLLFFVVLFIFKDHLNPTPLSAQKFYRGVHETDPVQLMDAGHELSPILYSPDSVAARQLMDSVGKQLNLKKVTVIPENDERDYYYGVSKESLLADLIEQYSPSAVVIFHNMQGDKLPSKLNYTIRMKEANFQTSSYLPQDVLLGAHNQFGELYETFMRLQWAIDSSFIKAQDPDIELPQDVTLQEFPYYQTERNAMMQIISDLISCLCWISLMITFVFLMSRLLEERTTGIQELIKMVGVSVHTLGLSHFLNVAPIGLVFAVVVTTLLKVTSDPLVSNTNTILIFVLLLMYFVSVIAMAFACSHLARSTQYATTISVFAYIALYLPVQHLPDSEKMPRPLYMLAGLLPHMPLYWFWQEVASLEGFGSGLNWSTMWSSHSSKSCSAALSFAFLAAQAAALFFLAWYLTLVRPGTYGQPRPWNFLFQRQYWSKNEVQPHLDTEEEEPIARDPNETNLYFERPPADLEVGIRVANVTKAFGQEVVLKNVSLDVYKGEITVLLGHNGAGKTTLMSIITGMTGATEGKVFVNGSDTETQLRDVRRHLGLCPQHNLFFPDLTVLEHVMFFTMLKTGTFAEAKQTSMKLVDQLGLSGKQHELCHVLSGGMKRRAQLACALAGGADLLVLDEPTSGLDVENRRELWDLLLSLRGSRTVLLTTHFMEEADALGDRVAALHGGRLRCHATTMHLKKAIGTGYRLSFTTKGVPNEPLITAAVTSHIPEAKPGDKTINSISYNLPAAASTKFPSLFTALESQRPELGIDSIGVGVSTLEEVFLKLCSDVNSTPCDDIADTSVIDPTFNKLCGLPLYVQQLRVLLQRQIQYIIHRKWSFLILQVILPILMICLVTKFCNSDHLPDEEPNAPLALDLGVYRAMSDKRVLYTASDSPALRTVTDQYSDVHFQKVDNITDAILRTGMKDILEYNKYIAGIELNDTNAKVLFTTTVRHAAPVGMNVLSNLLAARHWSPVAGRTITTINHPLADYSSDTDHTIQPKTIMASVMWAICITFIILTSYINLVSLPCSERETGARHIHIMCGCPAELHWAATLLAHAALAALCLLLPMVVAALALEHDRTINNAEFLGVMVLILLVGSLAFFASMYLVSLHFRERTASIVLIASVIIFGMLTPPMEAVTNFTGSSSGVVYYIGYASGLVAPPHALVAAAMRAVQAARYNAYCDLNRDQCPNMVPFEAGFDAANCCAGQQPRCYLCMDQESPLAHIIVMILQFVVYMVMVILTQRGIFSYMCDRVVNVRYKPAKQLDSSEMVQKEKDYVAQAVKMHKKQIPDSMLVDDVHKRYVSVLGKTCNAVQGVSFSVKKGECFGLLGVNGAGKSTTFKMLTAEQCPTRGRVYANGQHLGLSSAKYLRTLGYCPQFFGLDSFLTGSDNLSLLLTMRGHGGEDVREEVKSWINIVGLEKYAMRAVSQYSGGCVRRLGAAAALCVGGELTLLDEPTAGVDVTARRRVWAALRRGLRNQRSVVITSHSMDEMEALCSRIAIMSGGQVRALGSAAALRAAHAAGHAVVFKIRHARSTDVVDGAKSQTMQLKGKLHELFNCTNKDEHKTMLHYHINDTMKYSELFEKLESLKREFPALIEDYSVTETTLEEVFLSFARAPGHVDV